MDGNAVILILLFIGLGIWSAWRMRTSRKQDEAAGYVTKEQRQERREAANFAVWKSSFVMFGVVFVLLAVIMGISALFPDDKVTSAPHTGRINISPRAAGAISEAMVSGKEIPDFALKEYQAAVDKQDGAPQNSSANEGMFSLDMSLDEAREKIEYVSKNATKEEKDKAWAEYIDYLHEVNR
jgi:hypothetical protein